VLADDAALFRDGVARLLADAGVEVVAAVDDPTGLLAAVSEHVPDVVVTDIRMPPTHTLEGLEAARTIRARFPAVGVLVLSQYLETRHVVDLLDGTGGAGYLLKERVADAAELTDAIQRIAAGGSVVDPEVIALLVGRRRDSRDPLSRLTDREREVLALMAEGRSNLAIAQRLVLTAKTVETHVRSILTKLDLPDAPDDNRRVLAVLTYLRA